MNILRILVMALLAVSVVAAEPTWNPADAVKEAEQDIRTGHIKFYWSGSIASMPVGVPIEIAKNIPKPTRESAVSPTTYHFGNDRKNTPAGTTRRFLLISLRSTNAHGFYHAFDCAGHRTGGSGRCYFVTAFCWKMARSSTRHSISRGRDLDYGSTGRRR